MMRWICGLSNMKYLVSLLLFLATHAQADSFRCGTRIVVTGDSISRLIKACGQPTVKYKAKESIKSGGNRKSTGVTQWVYDRGRKKNMVVSVHSGKVVKIAVD